MKATSMWIEYSLKLDSNPEFTGSVLVAYARAAHRLSKKGESGAKKRIRYRTGYAVSDDTGRVRAHML